MKYVIKDKSNIKNMINMLPIEELLKIVTCPNYRTSDNELFDTYCAFIHPSLKDDLEKKIKEIRKLNHPVLIASDMEAGPGGAINGATKFPSMRAVRETNDSNLAYEMGKIAALESRSIGFNWTFAPCVDILGNHFSPITSLRSASEDYKEVIEYTKKYKRGLEDNGLIATIKHFPGDGNCLFDQHLTTVVNPLSKETWDNTYYNVYKEMIDDGVKVIMPGHIALPVYDDIDEQTNLYPPATLSYNLLTKLLKEKLGFKGLIISDATEMGGFCGYMNYYLACARFLMSGGDCLLFAKPDEEFISNMKELIQNNYLTREILEIRAYRVLCFVYENYKENNNVDINLLENQQVSDEIVNKSVKVFKNNQKTLPIKFNQKLKIAHVVISNQLNMDIIKEFTEKLSKLVEVNELIDPGCDVLKNIVKARKYDYIICTCGTSSAYGTNMITLSGTIARNMMNGWTKYSTPVIFVDFGNPYLHEEYQASIDTLIYTYGYANRTIDKVIELIFGK